MSATLPPAQKKNSVANMGEAGKADGNDTAPGKGKQQNITRYQVQDARAGSRPIATVFKYRVPAHEYVLKTVSFRR